MSNNCGGIKKRTISIRCINWHEKKKLKLSTNTRNVYSSYLKTCIQLHSTAENSEESSIRYQYFILNSALSGIQCCNDFIWLRIISKCFISQQRTLVDHLIRYCLCAPAPSWIQLSSFFNRLVLSMFINRG